MNDIKIEINNYKLLKNFEQDLKNCRVLLVTADNEKGKSSLIRGFIENMTAKSVTDDPVTHGKESGSKTFTIPDKDGNPCVIHHEFSESNKKGTFYAIDHLGKKVSSVTKIRELVGTFEELSIDTFYNMQQSAEGRRKIIKNYFYPLLLPNEVERIIEIDKRTSKGGEDFDLRTNINSVISYLESQLKANLPSNEDKVLAEEYPVIVQEIEVAEKKVSEGQKYRLQADTIEEQIKETQANLDDIPNEIIKIKKHANEAVQRNLDEIEQLEQRIATLKEQNVETKKLATESIDRIGQNESKLILKMKNLKESKEGLPDLQELENLDISLKELRGFRDSALESKNKIDVYNKSFKEVQEKRKEQDRLDKVMKDLKQEKVEILSNSKLPAGLEINGDDFTWNGFSFNDAQISKSSAMLVIAEILCNIIGARIVYIGEKALFNTERFNKLVKIAEKYGKIPVLEQVIENQEEIKVITEINE